MLSQSSNATSLNKVPFTVAKGNAEQGVAGKMKLVPGFVNKFKINVLEDWDSTLIGVKKDFFSRKTSQGSKSNVAFSLAVNTDMPWHG